MMCGVYGKNTSHEMTPNFSNISLYLNATRPRETGEPLFDKYLFRVKNKDRKTNTDTNRSAFSSHKRLLFSGQFCRAAVLILCNHSKILIALLPFTTAAVGAVEEVPFL